MNSARERDSIGGLGLDRDRSVQRLSHGHQAAVGLNVVELAAPEHARRAAARDPGGEAEPFGQRQEPEGAQGLLAATLGRADAMSLDQARKKAMTYLAKAANQEDPQSNVDAQRQLKTIDELVEAYIENHAKKKKKT